MKDVTGQNFTVGDRVVCAFSFSRASVGYLRLGTVEIVDPDNGQLQVRWEKDNKLSPPMRYGDSSRWLLLS